jgi:hypothetical protein
MDEYRYKSTIAIGITKKWMYIRREWWWWWRCNGRWWGMMPWPPMIHVEARMMSFCKFSLQIPSGGEVYASCGVSQCRILNQSLHDENIWWRGGDATWYGCAVREDPACMDSC